MSKPLRFLPVIAMLAVLLLAACDGENGSNITLPSTTEGTATTEAPDTTAPAETTEAPDTTEAPNATQAPATTTTPAEDASDPDLTLVLIVGGILLIILIVALVFSRGQQETTITTAAAPPPVAAHPWSNQALTAYANTRWCADHITEQLATWRGDTMIDGDTSGTDPVSATNAATWSQLRGRMTAATNSLYALEGAVPAASQPIVRSVVDSLNGVQSAADQVATSQVDVRRLEARGSATDDHHAQGELASAQSQRTVAIGDLTAKRQTLNGALQQLNTLQ